MMLWILHSNVKMQWSHERQFYNICVYEYTYVCVGSIKGRIKHSRVGEAEYSARDCYVPMS